MFRYRFRSWRRTLIGVPILVLAAGLTWGSLAARERRAAEAEAGWGALGPVVVVVRPVPAGAVVPAAAVSPRNAPAGLVPPGAVPAPAAAAGRFALVDLVPGEILVASRLSGHAPRAGPPLPAGTVALTVAGGPGTTAGLTPGDVVRVLATVDGPTTVVADSALVVAVDESDLRDGGQRTTLAVPDTVAPALANAVARGAVTLALVAAPAP